MQMYDNLDWPVAVQELIQAAEYLTGTGSPKVCFGLSSVQDMPLAACRPHFVSGDLHDALAPYLLTRGSCGMWCTLHITCWLCTCANAVVTTDTCWLTYIVQLQNDIHCLQVAAIGFCMGGALAVAASQYSKIHAAVACYGIPQFEICPVSSSPYNPRHTMPTFAGTTANLSAIDLSCLSVVLCGT